MLVRRVGKGLLGVAVLAAIAGLTVTFWPTEAARPWTLQFSVQCLDHSTPSMVWVETPNDEGVATQTAPDPYNTHYGTYKYAVTDLSTQYSIRVTCMRRDTDPSVKYDKSYTLASQLAKWGNAQNFECSTIQNDCRAIANNHVTIQVDCEGDARATEVFVIPGVNAAGSARKVLDIQFVYFQYGLPSPVTPYSVEVNCSPKQGKAWTAKSDPNTAAIGDVNFLCERPVGDAANGQCTH